MNTNTFELDGEYVAHTYARFPIEIASGKGSVIYDTEGKEYIDMATGIAVNIFGQCDDIWAEAVKKQLGLFQHTSNLYYSAPCANLAELLCQKTGMKKVFFGNSGAEANECAIKVARKYAAQNLGADTYKIITLVNSFHGRTITTLAATGQEVFHKDFLPLTEGFLYCEANDCENLKRLVSENKVAAIMFECVQGEGGVMPLTDEFVKTADSIAKEKGILLICDEVQCGLGRSGQFFGYMNYGITPDIVSTAKGLGGGLPIGAALLGEKVADVLMPGDHGSTFGGNPVSCAGACSVVKRIDDTLLSEVKEKSKYIFDTLNGAPGIKSVSGMGLMIGIETEKPAKEVVAECMKLGVLPITAKTKVRLLPALNIPWDLLKRAVQTIKEVAGN